MGDGTVGGRACIVVCGHINIQKVIGRYDLTVRLYDSRIWLVKVDEARRKKSLTDTEESEEFTQSFG